MKNWNEKKISLSDLKKIESIKYSKTYASWIQYYHRGIPAFRIERAYIANRWDLPPVELLKFNIFCFSQRILNEITPPGFRFPTENDWNKIKLNSNSIDNVLPEKYGGDHHSYLFFSKNDFDPTSAIDFVNIKPHREFFISNFERTVIFQYNNLILNQSNQLELRKIIDLVGYPRFMMKFIR